MHLPWSHPRCIVCLESTPLTEEHVIPGALGGRLVVKFLCKPCNDRMGELESGLKRDPSVRLAVENLRTTLPTLAKSIDEGQTFFVTSEAGRVRGVVRKGRFKVRGTQGEEDSLILPTDRGRDALAGMLRKAHSEAEVGELLARFDSAPEDVAIDLGEHRAIRRSHDDPRPALVDPLVGGLPILKMAHEFLGCHLGSAVYDSRLDHIREVLLERVVAPDVYRVERLRGERYRPTHGLVMEQSVPHVVVQVRLFGWLGFRVHFLRVAWGGAKYVYTLDLTTGEEAGRQI